MQFVLIDENEAHNEQLSACLHTLCEKSGFAFNIALATTNPDDVRAFAEKCTQPTVYFMAVQLDENQTTLSLSSAIQQNGQESYIVYLSAHTRYALDCLHAHAFDFLLKPWTQDQIYECLQAVMHAHARRCQAASLQVNMGSQTIILPLSDILYFTRDKMNTRMFLEDGSLLEWRESFDHLLPRLMPSCFCLCHRSFIVNLHKIRAVNWEADTLTLSDGTVVPISRRRLPARKSALRQMDGAM